LTEKKAARERDPEATRAAKRAERECTKDWYQAYEEWRYYNQPGRMESTKARAAQWAREHRMVMLVYGHVRRARRHKAEGTHTADDIRLLYEAQGGLCYYWRNGGGHGRGLAGPDRARWAPLGIVVGVVAEGPLAGRLQVHGAYVPSPCVALAGTAVYGIPRHAVVSRGHGSLWLGMTPGKAWSRWLMHIVPSQRSVWPGMCST
jgi:hypothetical protein